MEEDNYAAYHTHTHIHKRWDAELLFRFKDALISEKSRREKKVKCSIKGQQSYLTVISRWNGYTAFSRAGRECVSKRGTCVCVCANT